MEREGIEAVKTTRDILKWANEKDLTLYWGQGARSGSCLVHLTHEQDWFGFFTLWTYGRIEIQFQVLKNRPIFEEINKRMTLLKQLNSIPGVSIPDDGIDRRPSIPFSTLQSKTALQSFLKIWENVIQNIISG
jgi:hypothetical protein